MNFVLKEMIENMAKQYELGVCIRMFETAWDNSGIRYISIYKLRNQETGKQDRLINQTLTNQNYCTGIDECITVATGNWQVNSPKSFNGTLQSLKELSQWQQTSCSTIYRTKHIQPPATDDLANLIQQEFGEPEYCFSLRI